MARKYSAKEAKTLSENHIKVLEYLEILSGSAVKARKEVELETEKYVTKEVMRILSNVSVDELNRDKAGLRVKTLRDSGINTIADILTCTRQKLEAINGISEDGSYTIKKRAEQYKEQTVSQIKVRLNADDRSESSTGLVKALDAFMASEPVAKEADELLEKYGAYIRKYVEDIRPACSNIKWIFAKKSEKQVADIAFENLTKLRNSDFFYRSRQVFDESERIRALSNETVWKDFETNPIAFFTTLEQIAPGVLGNGDTLYGLPEELAGSIKDQNFAFEGLKCTLRNYQLWGVKYILHQERVLLGDEMGLGKTVQAIAAMVSLKNAGETHFMVVCPASVITNWCREIVKHSTLSVTKIHGADRMEAFSSWLHDGGVAVTTYETTGFLKFETDYRYSLLTVDEAHYIKNPSAKRSMNVKHLSKYATRLLFMTGTALENNVDEMINLIGMLQPDVAKTVEHLTYMSSAREFREKIAPVYYRRKRDDVLKELPELIESLEWCNLFPEEEVIYESNVLKKDYAAIRQVSWKTDDLSNSCKAIRLKEIIDEAKEDGRKVLVFSFYLDTIRKIHEYLGDICMEPINGSVSPQRRQEIIDEFDRAQAGSVLLSQIMSGGTGLNIQSASVVVICEPQLKPSVESQAISRAYRMGQARNVLVYRLLCDETVDERILEVLAQKQDIFNAFADRSVAAGNDERILLSGEYELDENTLGKIIEEEVARIREKKASRILAK